MSVWIVAYASVLIGWAWSGGLISSWDREATTSVSIRSPKESIIIDNGDTVSVPTDFELRWGVAQDRGPWKQAHEFGYQRQTGTTYWTHDNMLERNGSHTVFGIHETYNGKYLLNSYAEVKVGALGVGVSRNYTEVWTGNGATMLRLSLRSDQPLGPVSIRTAATYETNWDRSNGRVRVDVIGASLGKVRFEPFAQWSRIGMSNGSSFDSWQSKLKIAVSF